MNDDDSFATVLPERSEYVRSNKFRVTVAKRTPDYPGISKSHLKSFLLAISSGGMFQGTFLGKHSSTLSEKSEKSTSYSVRMPSVSGSISPAWPNVFASRLRGGDRAKGRVQEHENPSAVRTPR